VRVEGDFIEGPTSRTRNIDPSLLARLERGLPLDSLEPGAENRLPEHHIRVLDDLHGRRHLAVALGDARDTPLLLVTPRERGVPIPRPVRVAHRGRLSRFAVIRRVGDVWEVESGRSPFIGRLSQSALSTLLDEAAADQRASLLEQVLASVGFLDDDDDAPGATLWEPLDRLFLEQASDDRAAFPATFRFSSTVGPEPLNSTADGGDGERVVSLPRPDTSTPDTGLWSTVHARRTIRSFDEQALHLDDLSRLLWHSLHATHHAPRDPDDSLSQETALCPVPSTGALQAVRLWLDCRNVDTLETGPWRYDPVAHSLHRVHRRQPPADVESWRSAMAAAPLIGHLVLRHPRIAWKYERVAAKLALLDAGAALHGLQIAATGLGLGLWPIATGPIRSIQDYLGLDPDLDVPLAHFALGAPPRATR
jgi:SagB-type dehydrogenase family enzyme